MSDATHVSEGHELSRKGLSENSIGLIGAVAIGLSCIAPAYTLTGALGPTVREVGVQLPAIFIVGFIPMLLVALGYRELNNAMPDSGTTFTWATKAFGPYVGWMGGWGLVAATVIVLSNLAGVAVDFFYLMLGQLFQNPALADLTNNKPLNVFTCLVFMVIAAWISYRGMQTTKKVQYVLVGFQLVVLAWFVIAAVLHIGNGTAFDHTPVSLEWFNPFAVSSFTAFAAGISLSIFIFWGWDVTLTMNEETKGSKTTPGRAATLTVIIILAVYLLVAVAAISFAGVGETGVGLGNEETQDNVFAALAGPVMGPFALLMSFAVLSSSAASLQSTFVGPARTLLAMGHYKALPTRYASINPRFRSPGFATVMAGVAAWLFYAVMRFVSDSVLSDTITALGMMVCFYYGITALACVWYFRREAFSGARNIVLKFLAPLLGGIMLVVTFITTSVDSIDPAFGSGSEIGGIGLVFLIGVGVIGLGVVLMLVQRARHPEFFQGETLRRSTPVLNLDE
ncbi:APC family permease [Arthrobacter sp. I2-34]|uniref:APC family permease n=1 Tax=Arthrobacter hankyongi TaxID=2904801 RepID=A0ABS9L316_9MICC|nr:APC family permease [Arthrobacter hankyongi]MCG2621087.1 APC family permease [Arthrobacter hankyongi]